MNHELDEKTKLRRRKRRQSKKLWQERGRMGELPVESGTKKNDEN
jgi:hypothetical protein